MKWACSGSVCPVALLFPSKRRWCPGLKLQKTAAVGRQYFQELQIKASHGVSLSKSIGSKRIHRNKIVVWRVNKDSVTLTVLTEYF
jgi:hypothetical protein